MAVGRRDSFSGIMQQNSYLSSNKNSSLHQYVGRKQCCNILRNAAATLKPKIHSRLDKNHFNNFHQKLYKFNGTRFSFCLRQGPDHGLCRPMTAGRSMDSSSQG